MKVAFQRGLMACFLLLSGTLRADLLSFANVTNITILDGSPASLYPSSITVSGVSNLLSAVSVQLKNFSHLQAADVDMLLVAPSGAKYVFLAGAGGTGVVISGNYIIQDGAPQLPSFGFPPGTYGPTDLGGYSNSFPSPAPTIVPGNDQAPPAGIPSMSQKFTQPDPNGIWSLYVMDDTANDLSGSLTGGWVLMLTTIPGTARTATVLQSSRNPSFTTAPSNTVMFTATITSNNQPVTSGNVQFSDGSTTLAIVGVNGAGQCSCTVSNLSEGIHPVTANYQGPASLGSSSGSVTQIVDNHTVTNGNTFANPGTITVPDNSAAKVYPSHIFVSGLTNSGVRVSLVLSNLTAPSVSDLDMLLVGPAGGKLVFFSSVGGPNAISGVAATLADAAGSLLPASAFASGSYKPTDRGGVPLLPAPAPALATADLAATAGPATFGSVFAGSNPNGTWSLYIADHLPGGGSSSLSGWSLAFVAVPQPILTNATLDASGQFQFGFTGVTATAYSVLISTNLINWNVLGAPAEISTGVFRFIDFRPPTNSERFYRVRSP